MKPLIYLKDIRKIYQLGGEALHVLKGINLEIEQGSFTSIMGQSGSGKSTLMNIIGMLDTPTSGDYHFKDVVVSGLDDDQQSMIRRTHIWFIFQTYNLVPRLSALKQIMLPLVYRGISEWERYERAEKALIKVWLGEKMNNLPTELSGGQQQRVAIARALVTEPDLILWDEPTGALDSKTGQEVMELISQLHEEGKTILLITHDADVNAYAKNQIHIKDWLIIS
mgnify:CR=1 FL=1